MSLQPADYARDAHLRYASDREPGITRRRQGPGFLYRDSRGRRPDARTLRRIRALVIPPAWTDVWIAADPRAHLQATGRDARGRKQYRYHARWSASRDAVKYDRMRAFARALPEIRARLTADLRRKPLSRRWVLATVVRVLECSVIRVGNDEYRRSNGSYGLTTLQRRHVRIAGARVSLRFRAKSGVMQTIDIVNAALARRIALCQRLAGHTLFQYLDDRGRRHTIGSSDVNAYLRESSSHDFTAKDFRLWAGTLAAATALDLCSPETSTTGRKRAIVRALDDVAHKLGNTRAVCRKSYVHPAVLDAFMNGRTLSTSNPRPPAGPAGLDADERALLALLDAAADGRARAA